MPCSSSSWCVHADLRRIAKATGGTMLLSLADMDGNESVDPACLGHAESIAEEAVGDGELLYIKGCRNTRAQTIVLRSFLRSSPFIAVS